MKKVWLIVACVLIAGSIYGEKLDSFMSAVKEDSPSSHSSSDEKDSSHNAWSLLSFYSGSKKGSKPGYYYDQSIDSKPDGYYTSKWAQQFSEGINVKHTPGSFVMPYARLDYRLQYLETDSYAHDYMLEAGYLFLAFYGRMTRYTGQGSENPLNIDQYYLMSRFGVEDLEGGKEEGKSARICFGVGGYTIIEDVSYDGVAITVPITIQSLKWFGLEFRPAWAYINDKMIGDYDISANTGTPYCQLRIGYRWLYMSGNGTYLNGPYAGVSVIF